MLFFAQRLKYHKKVDMYNVKLMAISATGGLHIETRYVLSHHLCRLPSDLVREPVHCIRLLHQRNELTQKGDDEIIKYLV